MGDMYLIQSRYTGIESVFMKKPEKIMRGSMMGGAATSVMLPSHKQSYPTSHTTSTLVIDV